ncbi:MAG: hypothetical protein ACYC1I_09130 [Acidimicrobiales bacterium]
MTQTLTDGSQTYFYRSVTTSRRHHNMVSAYLVERRHDSNVVARIAPLGLVSAKIVEQEIALRGLRLQPVPTGRWHTTSSQHYARVRVVRVREIADVTVSG